jgi:hypothetical protein
MVWKNLASALPDGAKLVGHPRLPHGPGRSFAQTLRLRSELLSTAAEKRHVTVDTNAEKTSPGTLAQVE